MPVAERPEIDRWILSLLNTLVKECTEHFENYEPTRAGRAIQDFVGENLSNWYVRLCRKRFWGTGYSQDKLAAYQTLYVCLETVAKLMAPISPFYADQMYMNLVSATGRDNVVSVHLAKFPVCDESIIDKELESRMQMAQKVSSMGLALRKKINIIVKQPLQKLMIPVDAVTKEDIVALGIPAQDTTYGVAVATIEAEDGVEGVDGVDGVGFVGATGAAGSGCNGQLPVISVVKAFSVTQTAPLSFSGTYPIVSKTFGH